MRSYQFLICIFALILLTGPSTARPWDLAARQDKEAASTTAEVPSKTTATSPADTAAATAQQTSAASSKDASSTQLTATPTASAAATTSAPPVATTTTAEAATTSAANENANPLPIHPSITPAVGLAGVILILTGFAYAIIGIRNKWLYVYLSTAYLASLAVLVLIIYIMNPPVSDAVQGAYFVAATLTGLIFGGLCLIFKEMTEGLCCALGGFCLSMWFLTLKEGGLIGSKTGNIIFICVMTIVAFSLSFSHYTRTYGSMVCIAFGGAQIAVLGIDCFSRAGMKEFWIYVWDLNQDEFPLGTTTYPITRGMRVESAVTVVGAFCGIITQMRLWKMIREHRQNKEMAVVERKRDGETRDAEIGRKLEDDVAKERKRWEMTYGNKKGAASMVDSGVDYKTGSERPSVNVSEVRDSSSEDVEMVDLGKKSLEAQGPSRISIQVAEDDIQRIDEDGDPVTEEQREQGLLHPAFRNSSGHQSSPISSRRSSQRQSFQPGPKVVPLPIPIPGKDDTQKDETIAPEGSVLSRNASRRSDGSAKRFSRPRYSKNVHESEEDLVIPHIEEDRASSIAATFDELDSEESSLPAWSRPVSAVMLDHGNATTPNPVSEEIVELLTPNKGDEANATDPQVEEKKNSKAKRKANRSIEGTEAASSTAAASSAPSMPGILTPSTNPIIASAAQRKRPSRVARSNHSEDGQEDESRNQIQAEVKSSTSRGRSTSESLSADLVAQLPARSSKIAQIYRTNEWAKHAAEAAQPNEEEDPEPEIPGIVVETGVQEAAPKPVPVDAVAHQEAAQNTVDPSTAANDNIQGTSPSSPSPEPPSGNAISANQKELLKPALSRNPSDATVNTVNSRTSLQLDTPLEVAAPHLARHSSYGHPGKRNSSMPLLSQTLTESPIEETNVLDLQVSASPAPNQKQKRVSTRPANTLMNTRESMLKNRMSSMGFNSSPDLNTDSPTPDDSVSIRHSYISGAHMAPNTQDADDMPLSQRRQLLRQSSSGSEQQNQQQRPHSRIQASPTPQLHHRPQSNTITQQVANVNTHQPQRTTSSTSPETRADRYARWRESLQTPTQPIVADDSRRSRMMEEQKQRNMKQQQRIWEAKMKEEQNDRVMRSGSMVDAHQRAMMRMQARANEASDKAEGKKL